MQINAGRAEAHLHTVARGFLVRLRYRHLRAHRATSSALIQGQWRRRRQVNARHASAVVLQRVLRGRALRHQQAIFKKLEAAYLGDDTSESVHTIPQAEVAQLSETSSCGHVYGELSHEGAETVLRMMRPAHGDVLYDMGSGAGRFVVHAALALPHVRVVGVELSSVRHSVAFAASKRAALTNLHVMLGDMLTSPCEDATLVYFASLLFDARFMRQLCSRFEVQAPRLRMFVTLLAVPKGSLPSFALTAVEPALSVTWGHARAFVYTRRSATIEEPQPTTDPCALRERRQSQQVERRVCRPSASFAFFYVYCKIQYRDSCRHIDCILRIFCSATCISQNTSRTNRAHSLINHFNRNLCNSSQQRDKF